MGSRRRRRRLPKHAQQQPAQASEQNAAEALPGQLAGAAVRAVQSKDPDLISPVRSPPASASRSNKRRALPTPPPGSAGRSSSSKSGGKPSTLSSTAPSAARTIDFLPSPASNLLRTEPPIPVSGPMKHVVVFKNNEPVGISLIGGNDTPLGRVFVKKVKFDSAADKEGIQQGDMLLRVDGKEFVVGQGGI